MLELELDAGRICIVMMSAVGDTVHALPVVNALKRHAPTVDITWVLQPGPASLVRGHPSVDHVIEFDRAAGLRGFLAVRRALASRHFDLVIDLQVYFKAALVTAFANAPIKLGFDRARAHDFNWLFTTHQIPPHPVQHVQDQYLEFLAELGIRADPLEWQLGPFPHELDWQRDFLAQFDRPIASIVVATSKPEKDWAPERWARVVDALHERGLQPVLVGGRSARELHAEAEIMRLAHNTPHSALGSGLRQLVSILDASAVVLSPDTGPLHMAVALNRPVVSLLGYLNPRRIGPYGRFQDLMIDAYGDPGEDYPPTMEKRPGRMQRITVEQVVEKIDLWRERYAIVR
jgi:heptosyltransferase I